MNFIESSTPSDAPGRKPAGGIFSPVLGLFSNLWFGIALAVLLFIYCSIGSAIPPIRQLPWLEMTEFQWFHWWPFNVLVVLFGLTMVTVTVRRIPLRKMNLGVWMIHSGIVILTLGSYLYFGTKVEGDAPVFRRQVVINLPGLESPRSLVVLPGNSAEVAVGPDVWRFTIQSTNHKWPILSEENAGQEAYAVNVRVDPPGGDSFIRQLLAGYPQYTEDVIPSKGRAVKITGEKLVNKDLSLTLDYHPTEYFHIMDTWALFVRRKGEEEWHERPLNDLPRYHDRISSREQVFYDPHEAPELRPIDIKVPPAGPDDPLASANVHVTGYLRHAQMQRQWREGGDRLNPLLQVGVLGGGPTESFELLALDPVRNTAADGLVQFVWLSDSSQIESLPSDSRAMLHISVPGTDAKLDVPLTQADIGGDFRPIEGSQFAYKLTNLQNNLALPGRSQSVSIAMLEIKTPEGNTIRRWVSDKPEFTRDMHDKSADPHDVEASQPDPRIVTTYTPQSAPLIFAGHPGGVQFVFNGSQGRQISKDVRVGETLDVVPGLALRVDSFVAAAVGEVKPYIVPRSKRDSDVRELFSMVRLEVNSGRGTEVEWLPFNQYAFPGDEYVYQGRFGYLPRTFRLADGSEIEVLFSRKRMPLPNAVSMEDFQLDTHLGGYSGSTSTIRNYISRLRFYDDGKWTEPTAIAVNQPTEYGGFWYFQSTWDKPPSQDASAGMNYTGLGIGNREGVYVQLAGCCIAVIGMIFAFYVKPVMKRRRMEEQRAKAFGGRSEAVDQTEAAVEPEAVVV